jgi:hypothetical protein
MMNRHPPTKEHFAMHVRLTRQYLASAGAALLAALPISLVAATGALQALGVAYLVAWSLVVLPGAAAFLWLSFDGVLMICNRPPVLLTRLLVSQQQGATQAERRVLRGIRHFVRIGFWINPLANVAFALLVTAVRLRPQLFAQVMFQVDEVLKRRPDPIASEPYAQYSSPVLERLVNHERELVVC